MDQTSGSLFEWDIRKGIFNFSSNSRKKCGYEAIDSEINGSIPLSENINTEDMPAFVRIMKDMASGKPYSESEFLIKTVKESISGAAFAPRRSLTIMYDR